MTLKKISLALTCLLIVLGLKTPWVHSGETAPSFASQVTGKYIPPIPQVFNNLFSHYSEAEPLVNLLETFARSQGLRAAFTKTVKGEVSGRFTDLEPAKFLAGTYTAFGVEWYVLDDILHFYVKRDLERRLIYLTAAKPSDMKKILLDAGLLSPQLPCTADDDKKLIVFTGPASYAEGVAAAVKSYEDSYRNQQEIKVFFLKHAWADDTTVGSDKSQKVIPGVASILREMVLNHQLESTQLAVGTGQGAAVRDTIPPEFSPPRQKSVDQLTLEDLRQEAKEQMELDRKVASPMNTQARALPKVEVTSIQPRILADSRSNSVIVRDAAYRIPYYEKTIQALDTPLDLVEIHAAIVDVDTDYSRSLGVDLAGAKGLGSDAGTGVGSGVNSIISPDGITDANSSPILGEGFNFSTVYSHGSDYFLATVNALESYGEARVLGRPSVLTIDNTSATLDTSTSFYIRVVGENVVDLQEVSSGTSLTVTPHIIRYDDREPQIKLTVSIEDGQDPSTGSEALDIPAIVKKTNIETQGFISPGQSLLIGGYYYETTSSSEGGIPILMSLPGIGSLFKTTLKDVQRMERMILISPKIIRSTGRPDQALDIDEKKFLRSPFSTASGGIKPLAPSPPKAVGGCMSKKVSTAADTQ